MFLANKLNKGAGVPEPKDAQFNYVTMLLHGDGTNGAQNNTFLDSSTNNFTITRNGNTTQGSFSPYGSNWSNYFDGNGDYLSLASNAAFGYGSGNFTIEMWFNCQGNISSTPYLLDCRSTSTASEFVPTLYVDSSSYLTYWVNGSVRITASTAISIGSWNHVAVVRNSTTTTMYLNGTSVGTWSDSTTYATTAVIIGQRKDTASQSWLGNISNFRLVKGTAVYTTAFTPSTTPLTAITNTSLLTCQSNRFIDNSTNNFTITRNGDTSVQRFNPFGVSTAYSTSVIGGSGYFDGDGDYLSVADNAAFEFGTGDFTIEGWINPSSVAAGLASIVTKSDGTGGAYAPYLIGRNGSSIIVRMSSNGSSWGIVNGTSFGTLTVGQWFHFALVRNGTAITGYLNGVGTSIATTSASLWDNSNSLLIGAIFASGGIIETWNGYISNVRLVKGTAVYTSNFTPPTAPLTAITNTSLLTNMTNGAIFDNAMMNDLETVGNAQISTSVVKYGTGSLAFDGTGDYLKVPASPNLIFGTGDFTIECWIYVSSNPAQYTAIVSNWAGADPAWILDFSNGSGNIRFNDNGNLYLTSSSTLTTGQWNHVAVSRSGTSLKMFFNGTSVATATNSTSFGSASAGVFVGAYYDGTYPLNGYIDDLRITKGYARYTANFTAPTAAFPNIGPV